MLASGAQQAQRCGTRSLFLAFSARRSARFIGGMVVSAVVLTGPFPEKAISCFLNGSPPCAVPKVAPCRFAVRMRRRARAATVPPQELACHGRGRCRPCV